MSEQDRLEGETVEEKDRSRIEAVRSSLAEYAVERYGLPSIPIVVETEIIPPENLTRKVQSSHKSVQIELADLPPDSIIHLTTIKGQIQAARKVGVDKKGLRQLKQSLKAA